MKQERSGYNLIVSEFFVSIFIPFNSVSYQWWRIHEIDSNSSMLFIENESKKLVNSMDSNVVFFILNWSFEILFSFLDLHSLSVIMLNSLFSLSLLRWFNGTILLRSLHLKTRSELTFLLIVYHPVPTHNPKVNAFS